MIEGVAPLEPLERSFFARDSRELAPLLLNKVLVHGPRAGRIVEVEAYAGSDDPASHAYRGKTPRNATMFGPAGHLYVYFTYGMHWCANVVAEEEGVASAVLLRALAPLCGVEEMWADRLAARAVTHLCSGPAKLCQALRIDAGNNGDDLTRPSGGVWVGDDGTAAPPAPAQGERIGIRVGQEHPWRWWVDRNSHVSGRS